MHNLAEVPLFAGLEPNELDAISHVATTRTIPAHCIVISEQDVTDTFYLLLAGKVQVFLSDSSGKEFILNVLEAGEHFGELALLDEEKRTASVITLEKCTFMVINRKDFKAILEQCPSIYPTLINNLVGLVRQLTDNVKMLALKDVYGRLRKLLLDQSLEEDGVRKVQHRITQQDIAKRIGSSREMVARIIKELVNGGYIKIDKKVISILKKLPESF